jgi:hypothetical protein
MIELARSKEAMALASLASVIWALGDVLAVCAYATYSGPQDASSFRNLAIASDWLIFVSVFVALCATSLVTWRLYVDRRWTAMWEVGGTALPTLIFAIGLLILAIQSPRGSTAGHVVAAVGLAGWAVLLVFSAARRSLAERETPGLTRQAGLQLGGAAAIALVAISIGVPGPTLNDGARAITDGVFVTLGFAALALVLTVAHTRRVITTEQFPILILSLGLLALGGVATAVVYGLVSVPPPHSLTTYRVSLPIPPALSALGFLVLAWAAFGRLAELSGSGEFHASTISDSSTSEWSHGSSRPQAPPPKVPPSWQTDPTGRHELRWWEGAEWTEHVMDASRPAVDPL